ncbi:fatty acid--CoA ligase FadD11 [Nocardia sp. NPDC088792]|uniref:fatty acid--CoA ligase FadD11 n=1 Tax=Nocardia sp. NPDC088792 TaxID=3364332 RepID=UPI0037F30264
MNGTDLPTLCAAFQHTAAIAPDAVALRTPGDTVTLTWRRYSEQVRDIAAGLAALGISPGDTIALMLTNRIEFYPIDVAAQHLGATVFSVYNTLAPAQLGYVLGNSGARVVICEASFAERVRDSGAAIDRLICLDGTPAGTLGLDELIAGGAADFDFDAAWRAVRPDDIATLIYTSGSTGAPKGVETTHANLMFQASALTEVLDIRFGDRMTSFLPSAHIADRFTGLYIQQIFGTQVTVVAEPSGIAAALPDTRPTIWGAVPRVWEKLRAAIEFGVAHEPDQVKRMALRWAMGVVKQRAALELAGGTMPAGLAAEWARADELVLVKLRERAGLDQVRWALSGAAPTPPATLAFFTALGVPIAEAWGMSELSFIGAVSHPRDRRLGSVGKLLPGMESTIAADGELLVRGPLVMHGYRSDRAHTAETVDAQGWLHTGDVFTEDADGHLRIVDRKKELIINAAGKNMSPTSIENAVGATTPLIGSIIAIGDGRPYNTALIVLDADAATAHATRTGLVPDPVVLAVDPGVVAAVAAAVAEGNSTLSRVEQIKRFHILPTFWEPGGEEITLTMKLRRKPVTAKYSARIDELYADPLALHVHEPVMPVPVP